LNRYNKGGLKSIYVADSKTAEAIARNHTLFPNAVLTNIMVEDGIEAIREAVNPHGINPVYCLEVLVGGGSKPVKVLWTWNLRVFENGSEVRREYREDDSYSPTRAYRTRLEFDHEVLRGIK